MSEHGVGFQRRLKRALKQTVSIDDEAPLIPRDAPMHHPPCLIQLTGAIRS